MGSVAVERSQSKIECNSTPIEPCGGFRANFTQFEPLTANESTVNFYLKT
jgi:hypothetical protein